MELKSVKILFFFLFYFIFLSLIYADYDYLEDKNKQISIHKTQIEKLENTIINNNFLIQEYRSELTLVIDSIKILSDILKEINLKYFAKYNLTSSEDAELINKVAGVEKLKNSFRQKIIWLYKYSKDYSFQVLFTSGSLNEFYVRLIYLNKISNLRKAEFEKIKKDQYIIDSKRKLFKLPVYERYRYIREKKTDQGSLIEKKSTLENIIKSLQNDNENLSRQIQDINKKIDDIKNSMNIFPNNFIYKINQKVDYTTLNFEELKGRLIFPVQSVNITEDFGISLNPDTKTFSSNNGIDVSIAKGSVVKNVASGRVELVLYIPFYGNTIIINHGNNYRTVYSILENITVTQDEYIFAGSEIARTSENFRGQCFHFEIWEKNTPLNPKEWIKYR